MRRNRWAGPAALLAALGTVAGCGENPEGRIVRFTIVQLSDISEVLPVDQGRAGGLARVATLLRGLRAEDPNTFAVLCGDLLSPSPMGRVEYQGEAIEGRQMVDVANALGLDFATFGNHEFDIDRGQLLARLRESSARWVSSNTTDKQAERPGTPFERAPRKRWFDVKNACGTVARVGLIGLTTDANRAGYVAYDDPIRAARRALDALRPDRCDLVIALTHQAMDRDVALARDPSLRAEIQLILGGHDDRGDCVNPGRSDTAPIFKSDLDARSVWVHRCALDTGTGMLHIDSTRRPIDGRIAEDDATRRRIAAWDDRFSRALRASYGKRPSDEVGHVPEGKALDGREETVRARSTNLTRLIGQSMLRALGEKMAHDAAPKDDPRLKGLPRLALFNSGAVRINDTIRPGPITVHDVLRMLPFPHERIRGVTMPREVVEKLLGDRPGARGRGAFVQVYDGAGKPLDEGKIPIGERFLVAVNSYLIDGRERGLEWLGRDPRIGRPDGLRVIESPVDALIALLATHPEIDDGNASAREVGATPLEARQTCVVRARSNPGGRAPAPDAGAEEAGAPADRARPAAPGSGIEALEAAIAAETDESNRLALAGALIRREPESRLAAEEVVAKYLGREPSLKDQAGRILGEAMPSSPPALIRALLPLLDPGRAARRVDDDFLRADVAGLLSLATPEALARERGDAGPGRARATASP